MKWTILLLMVTLVIGAIASTVKDREIANLKTANAILQRLSEHEHHEYQFDIDDDSLYLYSGDRNLGSLHYTQIGKLDSVLIKDNE